MDQWDSEGGATERGRTLLTPCESCGKMVKPHKEGMCIFCYMYPKMRPVEKAKPNPDYL